MHRGSSPAAISEPTGIVRSRGEIICYRPRLVATAVGAIPSGRGLTCMSSYRVWMHSDRERKDAAHAAAGQTSTFNPAERDIVLAGRERSTWRPLRRRAGGPP